MGILLTIFLLLQDWWYIDVFDSLHSHTLYVDYSIQDIRPHNKWGLL